MGYTLIQRQVASNSSSIDFTNITKDLKSSLNLSKQLEIFFGSLDKVFQGFVTINGQYYWMLNQYENVIDNICVLAKNTSDPITYTKLSKSVSQVAFPSSRYNYR